MPTIDSLELQVQSNAASAASGLNSLASSLQRIRSAVTGNMGLQGVSSGLSSVGKQAQSASKAADMLAKSNTRVSRSYTDVVAGIGVAVIAFRAVGRVIASWINQSNSYIENLNLFHVSMGEYTEEAQKFAETASEIMGIDPGQWMRNQGVFMTLATGFGVASDRAYIMSQNLTQLGYDLSSFFNITYEDAFQKLQSGISGELEPLRRLGYDLSEARLQQEALNLGITKSVSAMTQAEKAELRYYAIMTQVTTAQGDMARTLAAPANQLRVLQAAVTQAARALGNIFIPALNLVLPYAIAFMNVIREIANIIANLFGFELPEVDYSTVNTGLSGAADAADDLSSGLGNAGKNAKKLRDYLLGIDELNVISPNEPSSGSGGGGGGGVSGGGGGLGFELPTYDFLEGAVETKAKELTKRLKEWLGITDDIDDWADLFDTKLGNILETVGAIGAGFLAWKISSGFGAPLQTALGLAIAVGGAFVFITEAIDAWTNGLDWDNLHGLLSGAAGWIAGLGLAFGWVGLAVGAVTGGIGTLVVSIRDLLKTGPSLDNFIGMLMGGLMMGGPAIMVQALLMYLPLTLYACRDEILSWLQQTSKDAFSEVERLASETVQGVMDFFANLPENIDSALDGLLQAVDGFIAGIPGWVQEKLNEAGQFLDELPGKLQEWFNGLVQDIELWFDNLWKPIEDFDWKQLGNDIGEWLSDSFDAACKFVTEDVPEYFGDIWDSITETVDHFFTETLTDFVTKTLPETWDSVKEFLQSLPGRIVETLNALTEGWGDVGDAIWDGITQGVEAAWNASGDFVSGLLEGLGLDDLAQEFEDTRQDIEDAWDDFSTWVDETIIQPVSEFFGGIYDTITGVFTDSRDDSEKEWDGIDTWFDENVIQPVSDVFDGVLDDLKKPFTDAWNTVKGIWTFASTWFTNNVIAPISELFSGLYDDISQFLSDPFGAAQAVWEYASTWFTNNVIAPVSELFGGIQDDLKEPFEDAWSGIKTTWNTVDTWFSTNVTNPLKTLFNGAVNTIRSGFTGLPGKIKSAFSGFSSWFSTNIANPIQKSFKTAINYIARGVNTIISGINSIHINIPGAGSIGFHIPKVPYLAEGGIVTSGQLFVARENGMPELVGSFGRQSGVMNNDQIVTSITRGVYTAVTSALSRANMTMTLNGGSSYYPPSVSGNYRESTEAGLETALEAALEWYYQTHISAMAEDMRRQADKPESTVVQVGDRVITDSVVRQTSANGYRFTRS